MTKSPVTIRPYLEHEARLFLEIHHAAIRGLVTDAYPPEVIEAWPPLAITNEAVAAVDRNPDGEIRLIAEIDSVSVGIGALIIKTSELRACYVSPTGSRQGVGSALVREIERIAQERGLNHLWLDSSLTAEPLYASLGYQVVTRHQHTLNNGQPMTSVKMEKLFDMVVVRCAT
jgi:putative acetyltransferase